MAHRDANLLGPPTDEVRALVDASGDDKERVAVVRRAYHIVAKGADAPPPLLSWGEEEEEDSSGSDGSEDDSVDDGSCDGAPPSSSSSGGSGDDAAIRRRRRRPARASAADPSSSPTPFLPPPLPKRLAELGFGTPSPVQRAAAPCLLLGAPRPTGSKARAAVESAVAAAASTATDRVGRDLVCQAPTGSGKTLAFVAPLIGLLLRDRSSHQHSGTWRAGREKGPRACVVTPTRELAGQTLGVARLLAAGTGLRVGLAARAALTGRDGARRPPDLVVATPARLAELACGGDALRPEPRWQRDHGRGNGEEEEEKERGGGGGDEPGAAAVRSSPPSSAPPQPDPGRRWRLERMLCIVLDEADKLLLEEGFRGHVDAILRACRRRAGSGAERAENDAATDDDDNDDDDVDGTGLGPDDPPRGPSLALFSATVPEGVERRVGRLLRRPWRLSVGAADEDGRARPPPGVRQRLLFCGGEEGKLPALRNLLASGLRPPVLVFVHSQERVEALRRELAADADRLGAVVGAGASGGSVAAFESAGGIDGLHGGQPPAARLAATARLRDGRTRVLICTDLAARGLDVPGVGAVVSFDCPSGPHDYLHRVGRTGRAGRGGDAITLFGEGDAGRLKGLAAVLRRSGVDVPAWMLSVKGRRRERDDADGGRGGDKRGAAGSDTRGDLKGKRGKRDRDRDEGMYGAVLRARRPGQPRPAPRDDAVAAPVATAAPAAPRRKARRAPKRVREEHAARSAAASAAAAAAGTSK